MSGHSDIGDCPNCGSEMNTYYNWKPFSHGENYCIHCGFYSTTKVGQMTLELINEYREEWNENYTDEEDGDEPLEMLTELPEMNFEW
jgi:hypothetical protein|tara:strand:+ start:164 stop:424 length:261 start_codon:yes stop_codon:yes gene_type:complete